MGVLFEHDDPAVSSAFKFNGKTVAFKLDYFGERRVVATVQDAKTGNKYQIFISLGHKSADKEAAWKGSEKSSRIMITTLNGQGRVNARVDRWSLNAGYVTFDYSQRIGNVGAVMTGYISHDPGKKAYIGYKTMTIRRNRRY